MKKKLKRKKEKKKPEKDKIEDPIICKIVKMKRKIQVWQYFHGVTEHCFWWKLIILFYFMSTIIWFFLCLYMQIVGILLHALKKCITLPILRVAILFSLVQGKKKLTHLPVEHKRLHYHQQSSIIERERESHIIVLLCALRLFFLPRNMLIHCIFWFRMLEKKKPKKSLFFEW